MVNKLVSVQQFQQLKEKEEKVHLTALLALQKDCNSIALDSSQCSVYGINFPGPSLTCCYQGT